MTELAAALSAIGTTVVSFGAFPGTAPAGERFELELGGLPEVLTPLVTILPLQRLASHLGLVRGVNPDSYRRDQPVYDSAIPLVPL